MSYIQIALEHEISRLRVAMAKAAQRAEGWPDSNDDPAQVLSEISDTLYDALDIRFFRSLNERLDDAKARGATATP